jgi:hypothetical protein
MKSNSRVAFTAGLNKLLKNLAKERTGYHSSTSGSDYDGLIFPVLWLDETAQADEKNADLLKSKLLNKIALLNGLTLGLFAIGILLMTMGAIHWMILKMVLVRPEERKPEINAEYDSLPKKKGVD